MRKFVLIACIVLLALISAGVGYLYGVKSSVLKGQVSDAGNESYQSCVLRGRGNKGRFCMQCLQSRCSSDSVSAWDICVSESECVL